MLNKEIIIEDDPNWAKKLQNYQNKKQVFYWPEKYFPSRINQIEIKKIENSINPITQKYKDDSKNILISEQEKKKFKRFYCFKLRQSITKRTNFQHY